MDKEQICTELDRVRDDFRELIETATVAELRKPTVGTRWNNEQLLFHMLFGPFHVVNYAGSLFGARVLGYDRMERLMDRVIGSLETSLRRASESTLSRGMHFPVGWDPYFKDYMTLRDVYHYPTQHYDHHRRQLTLTRAR